MNNVNKPAPKGRTGLFVFFIFLVLSIVFLLLESNTGSSESISYSDFLSKVTDKEITHVSISDNQEISGYFTSTNNRPVKFTTVIPYFDASLINFLEENKNIILTYNKTFKESRLQEVKVDDNYNAIPFESNPIALFVRNDILDQYGYKVSDINTWNDLIKIGTEIKSKTSGEFNLFSNEDKDNINLLITAQLVDSEK